MMNRTFKSHIVSFSQCWWLAVASLATCPLPICGQAQDVELSRRFAQEARARWEEYESLTKRLQGRASVRIEVEGQEASTSFVELKHNSECALLWGHHPGSRAGSDSVLAFNPEYSFALRRKESGSPWVIAKLRFRKEGIDPEVNEATSTEANILRSILIAPHYRKLTELVDQPSFRVIRVARPKGDAGELVQVDFDNTHPITTKPFFPIQAGSLVLAPERFWCVRSAQLLAHYSGGQLRIKIETEIQDLAAPYPVPLTYKETQTFAIEGQPEKPYRRYLRAFDLREPATLPPNTEFTLAAYGLLEPPGVHWKKPVPLWVWMVFGTVVLLLVGGGFAWLKRRALARSLARA